jgi:hypothetical protein
MKRLLPFAVACAGLFFASCAPEHRYIGSRIGWGAPVFLDSGRVGVAQVAWDEYEVSCSGYPGSGTCVSEENIRLDYIAFSPADGSLDTLFRQPLSGTRPAAAGLGNSHWWDAAYYPPRLVLELTSTVDLVRDFSTGATRLRERGTFSRSGRYLVHDGEVLDLVTGETLERETGGYRITYYDDVAEKALLDETTLIDFKTGILDSGRPYLAPLFTCARGAFVAARISAAGGGTRLLYAPIDSLDLGAPVFDTLYLEPDRITDFDPRARLYLRTVTLKDRGRRMEDFGIAIGDFEGNETVYRAQDYHPGFGARNAP